MPDLDFSVESAHALAFAAVPTIALKLRVAARGPELVRSIALCVQVRIAATQRAYTPTEQGSLLDVFGVPSHWGQSLKSLLWTVANVHVPAFSGETLVDLSIPCTYDFEVASAKYFDALQTQGTDVPIELLFSGTLFYTGQTGLQAEQISWGKEARFALPVQVWKDVMALYFPNSAWMRLHKETFDRLHQYRARNGLPTWEAALESLLDTSAAQEPGVDALEQLAAAVLYEGYVLWPYRRSARKNQQRWTFGGVYPRAFVEATRSGDKWRVQTECLVLGDDPHVEVELRCLQIVDRRVARGSDSETLEFVDELQVGSQRILTWDEAVERRWPVSVSQRIEVAAGEESEPVEGGVIVRAWEALAGVCAVSVEEVARGARRVTVSLDNTSAWEGCDRAAAQRRSFISAHIVLRVREGAFVSLTDPPAELESQVGACENVGLWPVLVGAEGDRSTLLASPIILYDYPQIAPESPGLLFDSGEIDQLLILNTLTLTDAEKAEVRATDPKAREILDRAESLTAQDLSKLHGAIRDFRVLRSDDTSPLLVREESDADGFALPPALHVDPEGRLMQLERRTPRSVTVRGIEIEPGSTVKLRPRHGADVFDLALDGRLARVESIEQDYDERVHLAVTLEDDPGRDLGVERLPGHRFFFSSDEVEPVP